MLTQEQLPMVALPSMNDTHLEELILINKLHSAARNREIKTVSDTLKELYEHTVIHFSDEEDMMEETLFPAYQMHANEHNKHLNEFRHLMDHFETNKDPKAIVVYIEGALIPWLIQHIQTMDTVTAQFLKEASGT